MLAQRAAMVQTSVSIATASTPYPRASAAQQRTLAEILSGAPAAFLQGIQRRWRRERRRRKVGRAYDMALEIARLIPAKSRVLDVGCGSGFIAHHLSAMLGSSVIGIDLAETTEAAIDYRQFDSTRIPVSESAVDAVLLCYVLHHAQEFGALMSELRRVLTEGGLAVVYEDIPAAWWDRFVCWTHDLKWRKRTGPCKFRRASEWFVRFNAAGFEVVNEKRLARWRNFAHPVQRRLFVLQKVALDES